MNLQFAPYCVSYIIQHTAAVTIPYLVLTMATPSCPVVTTPSLLEWTEYSTVTPRSKELSTAFTVVMMMMTGLVRVLVVIDVVGGAVVLMVVVVVVVGVVVVVVVVVVGVVVVGVAVVVVGVVEDRVVVRPSRSHHKLGSSEVSLLTHWQEGKPEDPSKWPTIQNLHNNYRNQVFSIVQCIWETVFLKILILDTTEVTL